MNTLWKIIGIVCLFLVLLFAGNFGKLVGKKSVDNFVVGMKKGIIEEMLLKTSDEMNKTLPRMLDKDTRVDSTFLIGNQINYRYTLVNFAANEIDPLAFKTEFEPILVNNACTVHNMSILLKQDVSFKYNIFGKNGKQVTTITVNSGMCVETKNVTH